MHYRIVNNLNLAHIVAGKDLWLTVIVTKVFQDACLGEAMMFQIETQEDNTDDEHPEQCLERERYVRMCTLNLCSCGGYLQVLIADDEEPQGWICSVYRDDQSHQQESGTTSLYIGIIPFAYGIIPRSKV